MRQREDGFFLCFVVVFAGFVFVGLVLKILNAAPVLESFDIARQRLIDDESSAPFDPMLEPLATRATQGPVPVGEEDYGVLTGDAENVRPFSIRTELLAELDGGIERIA